MLTQQAEPSKLLPSLESATKCRTFFLLATFTLLIDSTLILFHGKGLIHHTQHPDDFKLAFGLELFLLFVLFSFSMALIMPFIAPLMTLAATVGWEIKCKVESLIESFWPSDDSNEGHSRFKRNYGYVLLSELKIKAFKSMDSFYLTLYKEELQKQQNSIIEDRELRFFASATLLIGLINLFKSGDLSLLNIAAQYVEHEWIIWIFLGSTGYIAFNFLFCRTNLIG